MFYISFFVKNFRSKVFGGQTLQSVGNFVLVQRCREHWQFDQHYSTRQWPSGIPNSAAWQVNGNRSLWLKSVWLRIEKLKNVYRKHLFVIKWDKLWIFSLKYFNFSRDRMNDGNLATFQNEINSVMSRHRGQLDMIVLILPTNRLEVWTHTVEWSKCAHWNTDVSIFLN